MTIVEEDFPIPFIWKSEIALKNVSGLENSFIQIPFSYYIFFLITFALVISFSLSYPLR